MGDSLPPAGGGKPAAPAAGAPASEIAPAGAAENANAPAPSPPVPVSDAKPEPSSKGKRSRSEEEDIVPSTKRPRSEVHPAPFQATSQAVPPSKDVSASSKGPTEAATESGAQGKDKSYVKKKTTDGDKASPTKGTADSAKAGTKPSPSKSSPIAKGSATENKDGSSPRAPLVIPEDEKPLDLAAIRQFEFDQVGRFGPNQLKRYENFRRSDLKKDKVRKVCMALNPSLGKVQDPFIIAVKGLAKVFVGDVIESALEVRAQLGDTGALQPKHLREAYRRLRRDGALPDSQPRPGALG